MIKAVIFDMDGLLIDSEPIWVEAEIKVFNSVGVPLTAEMTPQTMGLRSDEVVGHWHKIYPWNTPSQIEVAKLLEETVVQLVIEKGAPMEGVNEAFKVCLSANLPIAIASSSPMLLITTVLDKFELTDLVKVVHTAHNETHGKPHPAVYISTAKELGIHPGECLAFEDSANGVLSAKAARMKCIAIPEQDSRDDKRFGIADVIINSLKDFDTKLLSSL